MDKSDASLFTQFCGFCWHIGDGPVPIILNPGNNIYISQGVTFEDLTHLDDIGLIAFQNFSYLLTDQPRRYSVRYFGQAIKIDLKEERRVLKIGQAKLSRTGEELASIAGGKPVDGFVDYVAERWREEGMSVEY